MLVVSSAGILFIGRYAGTLGTDEEITNLFNFKLPVGCFELSLEPPGCALLAPKAPALPSMKMKVLNTVGAAVRMSPKPQAPKTKALKPEP